MVIETFKWRGATKTHARNQHDPCFTLCGVWIPEYAEEVGRLLSPHERPMPTCSRCSLSVMKS